MNKAMRKPLGSILLIIGVLSLCPFLNIGNLSVASSPSIDATNFQPGPGFQLAAGPTRTGVLPAIEYTQSGTNTDTTGLISARTDENPSVVSNLTLDTANGWKSDQIELNITELRKLFVLNGTFLDGYTGTNVAPSGSVSYYPLGWDADSTNVELSKQTFRARYTDTSPKYIELELEGENIGSNEYNIYKDSEVYWYQDATHLVSETSMLLEFDLLYDNGPIGTNYLGDLEIRIEAGSSTLWSMDPVTLTSRDTWNHIGPLAVSLSGVPTSFEFRFVYEIMESDTFDGNHADMDGDVNNARYQRFFIDDLTLSSSDFYDPQDVNMRVEVSPLGSTTISGSNGAAHVLLNNSYWESSPVPITILADDAVSFDYEARFSQLYRFGNTSWTTNPLEPGIEYSVDSGESPALTAFFYIPTHSNLEDFTLELPHPPDYENVTVFDAASTDVTSSCTLIANKITITGSVLDSLGWWEVNLDAPNYARGITTQRYVSSWNNQTDYYADDHVRALVEISTPTSSPALLENLSIDWFQPNGTQWFGEVRDDGIDGVAYSQELNLEAHNATPGLWEIRVFWNNGTEIAYDDVYFDLFHSSSLTPVNAFIEVEPDTIVTCSVYLQDADTNEYLLDESSTIVGNWSTETVVFQRNLAKSRWEGELNTSLVGFGNFTIVINATTPYYSDSSCMITVEIQSYSVFTHYGPDYVNVGVGSTYDAKFRYSISDGTGIEDATLVIDTIIGPVGGLSYGSTIAVSGEPGNYTILFQVDIGGTYFVVVSASKVGHDTETVDFNVISGGLGSNLVLLNGTSDVMDLGTSYNLAMHYTNGTGAPLDGATATIANVVPVYGLSFASAQAEGGGIYTIQIDANTTGIYSISVRVSLDGYDTQIRIFTLFASTEPSLLSVDPTVSSISVDNYYILNITFTDEVFQGLEGAAVSVFSVNPGTGLWVSTTTELGSGQYSITLVPSVVGTYNLVLRGSLQNYQNSTALFTLVVTDVLTSLQTSDGAVSGFCYYTDSLEIVLLYEQVDNDTLITGALIDISAVVGLEYVVLETPGGYNITINPTYLGHWSLLITASRPYFRNSSMTFDFEVRATETDLSGDGPPTNIYFGIEYSFTLTFSHNISNGIDNATIIQTYRGVQGNPFSWIDYHNGTYGFLFTAGNPGSYVASIEFSKYGYESVETTFSFTILEMSTIITTTHLPDLLFGSRIYQVCAYVTSSELVPVEDADVTYSNSINPFVISESFANGWYNITFSPDTGNFSDAVIQIKKLGYSEAIVEFPLSVSPIPFTIPSEYGLESLYSLRQGENLFLSIRLVAGDTGELLLDAIVSYTILETGTHGVFENNIDGSYSIMIPVPLQAGTYSLRISMTKAQFTDLYIDIILISEVDEAALVQGLIFTGLEISVILFGILSLVYVSRRRQKRISFKKQMELLNIRARFNDANNIIGFIVLQKDIGLSVYSRIIKGGFDTSMISGFISAISNFALEMRSKEKLWKGIPISEIVTAVQTNELICALLTVDSPSATLIENLEIISFQIGSRFDSDPELLSKMTRVIDIAEEYKPEFDTFFETQFDYKFLVNYSSYDLSRKGEYPPIEEAIISGEMNRLFYVPELVRYLVTSGVEETRAYSMVIEAAESDFLLSLQN